MKSSFEHMGLKDYASHGFETAEEPRNRKKDFIRDDEGSYHHGAFLSSEYMPWNWAIWDMANWKGKAAILVGTCAAGWFGLGAIALLAYQTFTSITPEIRAKAAPHDLEVLALYGPPALLGLAGAVYAYAKISNLGYGSRYDRPVLGSNIPRSRRRFDDEERQSPPRYRGWR